MEAIFRGKRNYEIDKNAPYVIPWKWILPNMWYYGGRIKLKGFLFLTLCLVAKKINPKRGMGQKVCSFSVPQNKVARVSTLEQYSCSSVSRSLFRFYVSLHARYHFTSNKMFSFSHYENKLKSLDYICFMKSTIFFLND